MTSAPLPLPRALPQLASAIRGQSVRMTAQGKSSHVGSCLSIADILAVLYGSVLRVDPTGPSDPGRDRFILSKGHAAAAVYATLAEVGFFPREDLVRHCEDGSNLCGHVTHTGVPGVDVSTGSLGHGLPIGAGMALNAKRRGLGFLTYVLLSDGECDEGSVWEAAMFAAHHRLGGLVAIIDYNELQSLTSTHATLELEPFGDKWRSFGWEVHEIDGHDLPALTKALTVERDEHDRPPRCVIAHTTKGRGVSFMEGEVLWHYRHTDGAELAAALNELESSGELES